MIFAATASFFLAVVLGLTLVVLGMRYRRGSLALAVAHVVAALVGLALLLRHIADSATQRLYNLSAFLFVLALLGGAGPWRSDISVNPSLTGGLIAGVFLIVISLALLKFVRRPDELPR